jgi:YHS domain-containing protein
MTINPKTAAAYEYYGGKIYYFDSEECQRRFHNDPQAFVPGHTGERPVQEAK